MNNGLISDNSLNPENITKNGYMNSLAAEALRVGLLSDNDIDRLRMGLMETLAEVVGYKTESHSSSVKADTASELAESILYNSDTYLLSLSNHNTAISELKNHKISEMYGKGYLINKKLFESVKILYARARYSRLREGSKDYNRLLDVNLKNYVETYDPRFCSHKRLYVMLPEYEIRGKFSIVELPAVLTKLIDITKGKKADITL